MDKQQNRIKEFYVSTASINNVIEVIKDNDLIQNHWTVGISMFQKNLDWIEKEMRRLEYSFDYPQAGTFRKFLGVSQYLVNTVKDELISKEEGYDTVRVAKDILIRSFQPFSAYVCRRVKETDTISFIPEGYRKLYYSFNDDFSVADDNFLQHLMEAALADSDTDEEVEALYTYLEDTKIDMNLDDIAIIRDLISNSTQKKIVENSLDLDF